MRVRALLYPLAMIVIPATWLVAGQPQPYPFAADIAFAIPFLVDAAGNVLGLFAIEGFDAFARLTGWFFLTVAFGLAVSPDPPGTVGRLRPCARLRCHRRRPLGDRRVHADAERRIRPGADVREHHPGPGHVARGRGPGVDRGGDHAVAITRDAGVVVRMELRPGGLEPPVTVHAWLDSELDACQDGSKAERLKAVFRAALATALAGW